MQVFQLTSIASSTGRLIAASALLLVCACASVPHVTSGLDTDVGSKDRKNTIVGTHGPLSEKRSRAILARLKQKVGKSDVLDRHLAIEQAVAARSLAAGNRTELLKDGPSTFRAIFNAIRQAKHHINLEYYIFEDIESDGEKLSDLLIGKRRDGVAVNIIYDGFGSLATPDAVFEQLRKAGVSILVFNPLNPLEAAEEGYSPNSRDHRKILVVDGTTAIIGGVNLSTNYQSRPFRKLVGSDGPDTRHWRDTDLLIEGPAVTGIEALFVEHWQSQNGPELDQTGFFPEVKAAGKQLVRIIGSAADDTIPRYYATVLSAILNAEKSVWLTTAYFVPTDEELDILQQAARRGVDVRLMLPGESDSSLALAVGHAAYEELLEAGVKIFELQNAILHSKTIVIDGVWSAIGSSNFDHRSVLFNDEIDAIILGRETGSELEALFTEDQKNARQIALSKWRNRPVGDRIDETFSSMWQNLL